MQFPGINIRSHTHSLIVILLLILFSCSKPETAIPETCVGELSIPNFLARSF